MASEKIEVTYVFGFGRSDLISSNEKFANDFFYGYFNFLKKYKNIKFLEFNDNKKSVLSIISKILRKLTKLFSLKTYVVFIISKYFGKQNTLLQLTIESAFH